MKQSVQFPQIFLRVALAVTMLSAVADRMGFWGENAAWGNWASFEEYTRQLTFFLPAALSTFSAYAATFFEIILSIMLIAGIKTKIAATATGVLLLIFALAMSISLGIKAPLDYSVWIGSAASFFLANQEDSVKK